MKFSEYETTVIFRTTAGGELVEAGLDKMRDAVKGRGGKLLAINHWGKKKLAYDIEKQSRGLYVHVQYIGHGDLVHEIERNLRINDIVLRFLTVRVAAEVDPAGRDETVYVAPQYDTEDKDEEAAGVDASAPSAATPEGAEGTQEADVEAATSKEQEAEVQA